MENYEEENLLSEKKVMKIKGKVKLMKKNTMEYTAPGSSFIDRVLEVFGKGVSLQLISADHCDPDGERGKLGKEAYLEKWITKFSSTKAGSSEFDVTFDWDEEFGFPGAFLVKNHHWHEFFLKTLTLEEVPGFGTIYFICNSWVYPTYRYSYNRVFFSNKSYLTSQTPKPLQKYREEELQNLRGDGRGELKEWDRVYDYALYNDLGSPDKGPKYVRPILGNSTEFPYPRRGRTSRKPTKKDHDSETRLFLLRLDIYVPRDEQFNPLKKSDILANLIKLVFQVLLHTVKGKWNRTWNEFDTFEDVLGLHRGGLHLFPGTIWHFIRDAIPLRSLREVFRTDEKVLRFPTPDVVKANLFGWRSDEEFGREMIAGVNPVCIRLLQEFPPTSKLHPKQYGDHTSSITKKDIEKNMDGLTVEEALNMNKLFILDHHDTIMPYLTRINTTSSKIYATRTVLLLTKDGTLKPLAIELSSVHLYGEEYGAVNKVFTPSEPEQEDEIQGSVWHLAKAYAAVNDSGVHQLICHWLNTHAVMEPFIIASNRQLSVIHPIFKLLQPHYRDTMNINALARQILINAEGILESTVFPGKYAMEMSAAIYKTQWVFPEQALPEDLIKRGIAVPDETQKHGLRLLIEDYPYAVDGLEIWFAIKDWVHEYCSFYYPNDDLIKEDTELQLWWEEVRTQGHRDLKDKKWWPKMETLSDLTQTCTIIIWIASALHAAVNFGQFPYAGLVLNRPTMSRRFMPEQGTKEYAELEVNPHLGFLKTITSRFQTLIGVSLIESLSRHSMDEVYLGQRDGRDPWTSDNEPLQAFKHFGDRLNDIEHEIIHMNQQRKGRNRNGPVNMPYTLLIPGTSDESKSGGITAKGIPNSVSV